MQNSTSISICIPAYKNVGYLERLLKSIAMQTFQDYEVIITDDSPDNALKQWLSKHYTDVRIKYFKNDVALGTPENWNEGIRKTTGDWIKLMHDDDWFATPTALQTLFNETLESDAKFIFSAFNKVYLDDNSKTESFVMSASQWRKIKANPMQLYARNIMGHPSVTMVHKSINLLYDKRMSWLVDLDFYIQILQECDAKYIDLPLINIGVSKQQVTAYTQHQSIIEIPEALLLQSKYEESTFDNIIYFDAWWRLCRNHNIKSLDQFERFSNGYPIPEIVNNIIEFQKHLPKALLHFGLFSKAAMSICWLKNKP